MREDAVKEHSTQPPGSPAVSAVARTSERVGTGGDGIVLVDRDDPLEEADEAGSGRISTVDAVIRILALTRDAVARDLLMEIALDRGYGLRCAVDGAEAIQILGTEPPALMVVDIDTPDGRALIRALRANERWRGIPLLGLTATNNPMVTVSVDAPVFFKPDLDGLLEAVTGRFEPEELDTTEIAQWPRRPPTA